MLKSIEQIIVQTFRTYHEQWQRFFPFLLVLFIPGLMAVFVREIFDYLPQQLPFFILNSLLVIALSLVSLGCTLVFIRVLTTLLNSGRPDSIKKELRAGLSLILPAFFVSILVGLAIVGGFILFVIPGIIFSIWLSFAIYAVALDEKKGVEALRASRELVRGRWWSVFWRLILPALLFAFIAWLLQGLISVPFEWGLSGTASPALQQTLIFIAKFLNMAVAFAVLPLSTIAPTILYLDLKKNPVKK